MSMLGVIDPDTMQRAYWCPDSATDFLAELQAQEGFTPARYCHRCESYDGELAIHPWQLRLPARGRRTIANPDPVGLAWESSKSPEDVHLRDWEKSRPGRPMRLNGCHMCLISFLDEQEPPEITKEQAETLKAEFRAARDELRRLYRAERNEANGEALKAFIERRLAEAKKRLGRAVNACRDAGFEPARPRAQREGEEAPGNVVSTEWERPA